MARLSMALTSACTVIVAWGNQRLAGWSDYYQYVQRFLRSVVRLDPSRAISERLRDGLGSTR